MRTFVSGGRRLLRDGLEAGASDARVQIEREEEDLRHAGRKIEEDANERNAILRRLRDTVSRLFFIAVHHYLGDLSYNPL